MVTWALCQWGMQVWRFCNNSLIILIASGNRKVLGNTQTGIFPEGGNSLMARNNHFCTEELPLTATSFNWDKF